ncbi:MAG: hypothetical protein WC326_08365 [Candidatus Delongbacteria bacterium]
MTNMPTAHPQPSAHDCCLVIRWQIPHPVRRLKGLRRDHAERLLEDLVDILRPFVNELQVVEQQPDGSTGAVLRSWTTLASPLPPVPEDAPPHGAAWFVATAASFNPPTPDERNPT